MELRHIGNAYVRRGFRVNCLQLLVQFAKEMKERLLIPNYQFKILECFIPENALSEDYFPQHPNLFRDISEQFVRATIGDNDEYNFTVEQLNYEYARLPGRIEQPEETFSYDEFWNNIRNTTNDNGEYLFRNIGQLALNIFCLGHSNAECERKWSEKNLTRDLTRNRLSNRMVNALMHLSDYCKFNGGSLQLNPNLAMLEVAKMRNRANENNNGLDNNNIDEERENVHNDGVFYNSDEEMEDADYYDGELNSSYEEIEDSDNEAK